MDNVLCTMRAQPRPFHHWGRLLGRVGLAAWLLTSCSVPLAVLAPPAQAAPVERRQEYVFAARPMANLFYQLDCLAGQNHCSRTTYQALWQQKLQWEATDDTMVQRWQALRQRYQRQVGLPSAITVSMGLPLRFEGLDLWKKARIAALQSEQLNDLPTYLGLVMSPGDTAEALAIMGHFWPRFQAWWRSEAVSEVESSLNALAAGFHRYRLPELIRRASDFYQATLPAQGALHFHLIYRPALGTGSSFNGEQLENHSLIELRAGTPPESSLDVVIHELCHYLYSLSPLQAHADLVKAFADNFQPHAISGYNLLNEALATAWGNLEAGKAILPGPEFDKKLKTPGAFYNDPFIDPVARAIWPLIQASDARLSPAWVSEYLKRVEQALQGQKQHPVALLRTVALAYDPSVRNVVPLFQQRLRVASVYGTNSLTAESGRQQLAIYPALSGALFVPRNKLAELDSWQELLGSQHVAQIKKQPGAFVYGIRRNAKAFIFVFVADQEAQFQELFAQLEGADQPFEGVRSSRGG
jgi:hypothetical protein